VSPRKVVVNTLRNAQSREISGTITDETGNAVAWANIRIKNGQGATTSDDNGNYRIRVQNQDAILLFSYVGFVSQEIKVADRNTINLVLQPLTYSLDETVVVAYGTVSRRDLTGSV